MAEPDYDTLMAIPERWAQPPAESVARLPKGGNKDAQNVSCRECGGWHKPGAVHLDYMGHADVTLALIESDPAWAWEPLGTNEDGSPVILSKNNRLVLWGKLTVAGHSRIAVGTCEPNKGDPEKELIGDLLRNGAMRFGIGTRLWSKATGADPVGREDVSGPARPEMLDSDIVGRFRAKAHEDGVDDVAVADIVRAATNGRTSNPNMVHADEERALKAAYAKWTAEHPLPTTEGTEP